MHGSWYLLSICNSMSSRILFVVLGFQLGPSLSTWQYNSPRSSFKELLETSHFPRTYWEEPEQSQTLDNYLSFFLLQSRWKDGGIRGAGLLWEYHIKEYRLIPPFFITKGCYSASSYWKRNLLQEAIMHLIAGGNSCCGGGIIWKRSSQVRKAWSRKPLHSPLKSHICNPPEHKHSDICNMGIPSVDAMIKQPCQGEICLLIPPPHSDNKWVGQRIGSITVIL